MGKAKAITAVANKLLQISYVILRDRVGYKEIEPIQEKAMHDRKVKQMIALLQKEGYEISEKSPINQ